MAQYDGEYDAKKLRRVEREIQEDEEILDAVMQWDEEHEVQHVE